MQPKFFLPFLTLLLLLLNLACGVKGLPIPPDKVIPQQSDPEEFEMSSSSNSAFPHEEDEENEEDEEDEETHLTHDSKGSKPSKESKSTK